MTASFSTRSISILILFVFIFLSNCVVLTAASNNGGGHKNMRKEIDSRKILQEMKLHFGKSSKQMNGRRVMVGISREAPEGPDPQHH